MNYPPFVFRIAFLLLWAAPHVAIGCPSDLDTSFADGGVRVPGAGATDGKSGGQAIVVRPNGDILVAGAYGNSPAVYRYHEDGSRDLTFGNDGTWVLTGTGSFAGLVVDDDGRIVAAGAMLSDGHNPTSFLIARFTEHGEPDPEFGDGGVTITRFVTASSWIRDVTLLSDGRAVAVGQSITAQRPSEWRETVACYGTDGNLDAGFGNAGVTIIAPGAGSAVATSVVRVEGDATVISGIRTIEGDTVLAKLDAEGNPVAGFGNNGVRVIRTKKAYEEAWSVGRDASGRILVAGNVALYSSAHSTSIFVRRYLANGRPDLSYGRKGRARIRFARHFVAQGMAVSPDGHVSVPAWRVFSARRPPRVARFDPAGARDRTFGDNGIAFLPFPKGGTLSAAAIQGDQKLVVTGEYGKLPILARFIGGEWDGQEQCVIGCGDSVVSKEEDCDDGNAVNGDGCSAACLVE